MWGRNGYPTVDRVFEERRVLLNETACHEGTHRMSYQSDLFFPPVHKSEPLLAKLNLDPNATSRARILKRQCPSIFPIWNHYTEHFSVFFFLRTFLPPFFVWACKICVSSASRVGGQHILWSRCQKSVSKETYYIGKRDLLVSSASRVGGQHILCKGKERRATNERKQRNILCGKKTRKESRETLCGNACLSPVPRTKDGNFQNLWKLDFSEFMKMHACRQSHGTPKSVWPCSHPCYISNTLATH